MSGFGWVDRRPLWHSLCLLHSLCPQYEASQGLLTQEASPKPHLNTPHVHSHLHSQAEPSKQRDSELASLPPRPSQAQAGGPRPPAGKASILTSLALVLIEKLPQLLLLLPHRQLRHRRIH